MNEQELADLFSEQVDRLLQGEALDVPPDTGDLQELLNLVGPSTTQSVFQATSATQAAFQSQLANWFGLANGGSPMTILGLSKTWFFSILVTTVTIIGGAGFIAVLVSSFFFFGSGSAPPIAATEVATGTPAPEETPSSEPSPAPTDETGDPSETATPDASETPEAPVSDLLTLIIINELHVASLCQGAYSTQSSLVNYGDAPLTNAALAWDVIEGAEFVDDVSITSDDFEGDDDDVETIIDQNGASTGAVIDVTSMAQSGFANFSNISVEQNVDLGIEVDVNDDWWTQPDGAQIKVQLSVENKIELSLDGHDDDDDDGDLDRGHGNEPDGYDEDNPGRGQGRNNRNHSDDSNHSQVITIVKQTAQFVTLTGIAHDNGDQSLLVDGTVVVINDCTGLPSSLLIGSNVQIIGMLQPDGTFIAINIVVINVNIINGDFDSGVPSGGHDDDDDDDDGGGGRGGGGSGGSRGGS
ncbi:MAG TPA: hypothetical protein VGD99_21450 [Anaerolineae bacterium]